MNEKLKVELEKLPEPVRWRLQRCDGFLDLRMPARARGELREVPEEFRETTLYIVALLRLAFDEKDWPAAAAAARKMTDRLPGEADYPVQLAYAIRRSEGLEPAQFILEEAQKKFPDIAVIPFNLACYACNAGRTDRAMEYLRRAFELDPQCRAMAVEDEDLKPLWPKLEM